MPSYFQLIIKFEVNKNKAKYIYSIRDSSSAKLLKKIQSEIV